MAGGRETTTLAPGGAGPLGRLLSSGWQFDFFQAVWLLERHAEAEASVGQRGPVAKEPLRFRPDPSLGFPATDVRQIVECHSPDSEDVYYQVDVNFLGLYGTSTPLPLHYAVDILRAVEHAAALPEQAVETARSLLPPESAEADSGTAPARDFLDVFHHRLLSLFYRSWLKYRYDRTFGMPRRDDVTDYLLWLIGCAPDWDRDKLGVSPARMLRYAGSLTQHPKSAAALEGMLNDYWPDYMVEVEQCIGRWVTIAPDDLNSAGVLNSGIGVNLTVGEQVYDLSGSFNVVVGPVDWGTYLLFLPDGPYFAETSGVVELYCTDPLAFTVEVKLHSGEVPVMRLSSDGEAGQLGYTSWLRTDELPETSVTFSTRPGRTGARVREPSGAGAPGEAVAT